MSRLLSRLFRRQPASGIVWLGIAELRDRLADVVLIDVRGSDEFSAPPGHLPGAINLPLPELPARLAEVTVLERPVVLVCKTDRRSARAAELLIAAGVRSVEVLRGGTDGWHQQGLPLE